MFWLLIFSSAAASAAASADPCCSWDKCGECPNTTDYCEANQNQCENDCGGQWCPNGPKPSGAGYNTNSVCSEGPDATDLAYACMDWNVGSAAMLAAASSAGVGDTHFFGVGSFGGDASNMGKCYEIQISGASKLGLFQVVNQGGDVRSGQFDLQMGGGGFGVFNGCVDPTTQGAPGMFAGNSANWGPQYGGWRNRADCSQLPKQPRTLSVLPSGEPTLPTLCELGFDYGVRIEGGENPKLDKISRVACPASLVKQTGLDRTDFNPNEPEVHTNGLLTRMMDCCKPSAGWIGNSPNADPKHPAVIPCTSDGYSRIDIN